MTLGSVFTNNRTQAVRLPAEVRFPDTVSKVTVRVVGKERILAPWRIPGTVSSVRKIR